MGAVQDVVIVGASLAGVSTARSLRAAGFDGRILLIGDEPHQPYDRPPLSKGFLLDGDAAGLDLLGPDEDLRIEWRLGTRAVALDATGRRLLLSTGETVTGDVVVIATGASARPAPAAWGDTAVHTLRTAADAHALRAALASARRIVVIGAGFIGCEVASTARALGLEVALVDAAPAPMLGPLGEFAASWLADRHRAAGVELVLGSAVRRVRGGAAGVEVELDAGTGVAGDLAVAALGAVPCTGWLAGSGVAIGHGVLTDERGATTVPAVFAAGDVAETSAPAGRSEHWTAAVAQAARVAAAVLGTAPPRPAAPYFWSDQLGSRLQLAGTGARGDRFTVVDGALADGRFTATYERESVVTAVLSVDQPRVFGRLRRGLVAGAA